MLMSSSKATGERVHVNPFFVLKRKIKLERKSKIERKKEKKIHAKILRNDNEYYHQNGL